MCTKRNKLGNTREKGVSDEIRISSLVFAKLGRPIDGKRHILWGWPYFSIKLGQFRRSRS